ncbi:MAG TPA: hypothetical protein VGM23_12795, partial [Armatimonadota bacterium]
MRRCPKCGAEYGDADIRTMCGSCLVSLVPGGAAASETAPAAAGPVSFGPGAMEPLVAPPPLINVTVTMPEVSLPPIPEVPQIPSPPGAPEQEPGPIEPPLTPQPNPNVPPPFIPLPQPAPVPAPVPTPGPEPQPQPSPMPQPQPAPRPEPGHGADVAPLTMQPMNPGSLPGYKTRAALYGIAAGVCGFITITFLYGVAAEDFNLGTLLLLSGLCWLTVYLIRQAIYASAIESAKIIVKHSGQLGATLPVEVSVGCLRDITVTDAEITLTAEERAISGGGSGKSRSTYSHVLHTAKVPLKATGQWIG